MATVRAVFETGPDESGDFHVHAESGRTRGALSVVLAVPREPAGALGDALHDLHDPFGPIELDGRLGMLAGRAPKGTAFLVALEDQLWALPSSRLRLSRRRGDETETLAEPQVVRLLPGDRFTVTDEESGLVLAGGRVLAGPSVAPALLPAGDAPAATPPAYEAPIVAAPSTRAGSADWSTPPPRGRRTALAVGGLAVLAAAFWGVRTWMAPDAPPRTDAHVTPSLEERVVGLLAQGGTRSGGGTRDDGTAPAEAAPADAAPTGDAAPAATSGAVAGAGAEADPTGAGWQFRAADAITSSPLLTGGRLVFGSRDAHLYCLDAGTGEVVWSLPTASGIGSSPCASGGLVYVGTYGGRLLAVTGETGKVAWEAATDGRIVSSPCVAGSRVVVGSYDGRVHAFDARTGERAWSRATGAAVRSSAEPVGADAIVIGSGNGKLFRLAARDGAVQWERTFATAVHAQAADDEARGCIYVGTQGGEAACLDAATGEPRWSVRLGAEVNAQPRPAGDAVLFGTGKGMLVALDPASGERLWEAQAERGFDARPLVLDTLVVAPSFDGTVHLLELASGAVRDTRRVPSEVFSSPAADGKLVYLGTMDGTLHALALP